MNLAVAATTLALVIPAELPDKTFISCVVLSSRHRGLPVWLGGASALTVQALIAVVAGRLLALLPHTTVKIVVAVLFMGRRPVFIFGPSGRRRRASAWASSGAVALVSNWRVLPDHLHDRRPRRIRGHHPGTDRQPGRAIRDRWACSSGATVAFWIVSGLGVLSGRKSPRRSR